MKKKRKNRKIFHKRKELKKELMPAKDIKICQMWIEKRKNNIQKNHYYERKILLNYLNDHTEVLANVGISCHIFNLVI